jgi:hypothetical protein
VTTLERREAKTFVLPSVFGITYTHEGTLHQPHDRSQNFFTRQAGWREIDLDLPANCQERAPKDKHVLEL